MENRKHSPGLRHTHLRYQSVLAGLLLSFLVIMMVFPPSTHAASGTGDLMSGIPVGKPVDEHSYLPNSCGVVAATMMLDYYLPPSSPVQSPIAISTVGTYVKETYQYDAKTNSSYPIGSTTTQVQTGLEAASTDPTWNYGNPLKATWHITDDADWFMILKSELDARRPVIIFLANGGTLGDPFQYGHFIVVSGYTSDDGIIYHDPWDGQPKTISNADFARDWGTTWNGEPPWYYMQVIPFTNVFTTPSPTVTTTSSPTLLYSADWSNGLNGWTGSPEWSVSNGELHSDGSDGNLHLGVDAISPPYRPSTTDYAVEARIQIVNVADISTCYVAIRGRVQTPSPSNSWYVGDGYFLGFNGYFGANGSYDAEIGYLSLNVSNVQDTTFDVLQNQYFNPGFVWHTYRAEFRGNQMTLFIDGKLMAQVTDNRLPLMGMLQIENGFCPVNVSSFQVFAL